MDNDLPNILRKHADELLERRGGPQMHINSDIGEQMADDMRQAADWIEKAQETPDKPRDVEWVYVSAPDIGDASEFALYVSAWDEQAHKWVRVSAWYTVQSSES